MSDVSQALYTEKNIVSDKGLKIMRRRPTQYLPDVEHPGISHMIIEIQDNSFDEATLMGDKGVVDIMICPDPKRNMFQAIVKDNGRGIPIGGKKLFDAFTEPHTSGKYDTSAYAYSSGLFGVGAKVVAGLSKRFRAVSCRGREGSGSVFVAMGEHAPDATYDKKATPTTGMTVIFEPDDTIFNGVDSYAESGWPSLLERIKKYAFFHQSRIRFLISKSPAPENIWIADNLDMVAMAEQGLAQADVVFDSWNFDRDEWLRKYLGVNRPFVWSHTLTRAADANSSLAYDIRLFFSKTEPGFSRFGMINSVPIDSANSNHLSEVYEAVKKRIKKMIPTKEVQAFFEDAYKLPLYLAVEVKYSGAEFTGTTKHSFISAAFRSEYGAFLDQHFGSKDGKQALDELYAFLQEDIHQKYIASITGQIEVKNQNRLFQDLRYPEKYEAATAKDRSGCELFIVEGDSAGGGLGDRRNSETMGIYKVRGKPFNALGKTDSLSEAALKIQADDIYRDIIRIIGLNPQNPDMNALTYNRIIILTDADSPVVKRQDLSIQDESLEMNLLNCWKLSSLYLHHNVI